MAILDIMDPRIRPAVASDADGLAAVYNHFVLRSLATFEEVAVPAAEMASRVASVQSAGLPWLVMTESEQVIGYAYAGPWKSRIGYRFTVEISVYLAPDQGGRGLGTALYRALFAELEQTDTRVVIGGIALPNDASVALHEKMGMRKVAHFERVGTKDGQWLDVGYWQRRLDEHSV